MSVHPGHSAVAPAHPGQQTLVEVTYLTDIDGPGQHGEAIDILANDPHLPHHQPPRHDLWFLITVRLQQPPSAGSPTS